jgi:hypothetical protein
MTDGSTVEPATRSRRVLLGVGMAVLLLIVHVTVWREARNLLARHVAYPLVAAIDTDRAAQFDLDGESFDRTITAVRTDAGPDAAMEVYRVPANMDYLVAALVLIAAFPQRLYWFYLWLAHLAVGTLALAAFVVGVGWADAGFAVGVFLRVYALRAVSLLAVVGAVTSGGQKFLDRLA